MIDCQRIATWKIKWKDREKEDRAFACKDHFPMLILGILAVRSPGFEATVALHSVTNEEPCEFGVE